MRTQCILKKARKVLRGMLVLVLLGLCLLPIYWMINVSFKTQVEIFTIPPSLVPDRWYFQNYTDVLFGDSSQMVHFLTYFRNSLITAVLTVAVTLVVITPGAYALSRIQFKAKRFFKNFVLVSQTFPIVLILIPLYQSFLNLNLVSTFPGLIFAYLMFSLPFSLWMLKGYFDSIPFELDYAAKVDGCTRMQTMIKVVLPNVRPGLSAAAVVIFIQCWDEYVISLTLMDKPSMRTIPAGIIESFVGQFSISWGQMMAASVITSIPVVLVFILLSKHLIGGLTAGAVKS